MPAGGEPDPGRAPASPSRRPDVLPLLILAGIVLAVLAGWWLFPTLHRAITFQDCTAAGRTDCGGVPGR